MHSESRGVTHPAGRGGSLLENHGHGGVWACHKCGWTYPNPHPSAKHRRNHKKHCGKIEGFKLISSTASGLDERTTSHSHSDSDGDDDSMELTSKDHYTPPLPGPVSSIMGASAPIQGAHDSSGSPRSDDKAIAATETLGVVVLQSESSEEQVFSDAVNSIMGASAPIQVAHDSRGSPASDDKATLVTVTQGAVGHCESFDGQVFSDAVPYFSDTGIITSIVTKTTTEATAIPTVANIYKECQATVTDHMHLSSLAVDTGEESQESNDLTYDDRVQNPNALQIRDHALCSTVDTSEKNKSLAIELEEDRNTSAVECEQTSLNSSTKHTRTEDSGEKIINFPTTLFGTVIDAVGDGTNGVDGGNLLAGSTLIESDVDGSGIDSELHKHHGAAHVKVLHSLSDAEVLKHHEVAQVEVSEFEIDKSDTIKRCNACGIADENPPTISLFEPMELRVPITSSGDDVIEKTEGQLRDLNEMDAMSYLQQVDSENLSSGSEVNPSPSRGEAIAANLDDAALGLTELVVSQSPTQENLADCSFGGSGNIFSDETPAAPVSVDSKVEQKSDPAGEFLVATLGDAVPGLTEMVAAPSSSCPEKHESRFSHETVMTLVAVDITVEEKSYNQDGVKFENSLDNPNFCSSESTYVVSEESTKPPCHADTTSDELVNTSNITKKAAVLDEVVINSNGIGTNSNNQLGQVSDCPPEQNVHQNEVLQENPQLLASSLEDHSVMNTEDIEMENRLQQHEGSNLNHASVLVVDALGDSISQADSVEGYWGSVSEGTVPSEPLSTPTTEALADDGVQCTLEEAGTGASLKHRNDNAEIFEAPSFMTLVQPGNQSAAAEIQLQSLPSPLQAGWFPSQAKVAKESEGRKRSEEMMAKVVNWSSSNKPHPTHTPLRSLLVKATQESKLHKKTMPPPSTTCGEEQQSRKDERSFESSKENMNKDLPPLADKPHYDPPAGNASKEWNSPARFPGGKGEKRKGRGIPYWVTFVCCSSSVN